MMLYEAASVKASVESVYSFDDSTCRCPCKWGGKTRELFLGLRQGMKQMGEVRKVVAWLLMRC